MASVPPHTGRPDLTMALRQAMNAYRGGRLEEAAQACATVISWDSGNFDAHHLAGVVKLAQGDAPEAVRLLTEAVKLKARSFEAANDLGRALHGSGDHVGAVAQHERALSLRPAYPEAHNGLADAQRALGRLEEALQSYQRALTFAPNYAEALNGRGAVLLDLGRGEEALESCTKALTADPDFAEAHFNRGNVLHALGRHQRALASYDDALKRRPGYVDALANRSAIFSLLNRYDDALEAAEAALTLDPRHVDALVNSGVAAQHLGRLEAAVAAYDKALAIAPDEVSALRNRASAERDLGRLDAALESFGKVVALAPEDVDALYEQGTALRRLGRHGEALPCFEKALAISPANGYALGSAALAALNLCDWAKAERWGHDIALRVEKGKPVSPFVVLALSDSPRLHALAARNFVRDKVRISARPPSTANRRRDKIRLAYVAADNFSAAGAMAELAARHDRTKFDVIGMSFGRAADNDLRAALAGGFDHFHDVTARTDAAAARVLRELEVDIAVDLDGYVEDGRPGIFAARSAPIQVNFGYPATMGAEFIDYIMADRTVLPFDQQKLITEKIVHLPDCHLASGKKPETAPEPPSREAAGLPATGVRVLLFCRGLQDRSAGVRPVDAAVVAQRGQRAVAVARKRCHMREAAQRGGRARHRSDAARIRGAVAAGRASLAPSARRRLPRHAAVQRGERWRRIMGGRAGRDLQGQCIRRPHRRQPAHGSRPLRSDRRRPRRLRSPGVAAGGGARMAGRPQAAPRRGACRGAAVRHRSVPPPRGSGLCPDGMRCCAAAPRRKALP